MLNFQVKGNGYPILLIHGLFGSLENLNTIARSLAESFQVISIDLPNHGKSPRIEAITYSAIATTIEGLRDHLNLSEWHILGHSMGGKSAMQYAIDYPDKVNKLIIADISPVTYQHNHHDDVFAGLKAVPLNKVTSRQQAHYFLSEHIEQEGIKQFLLKSLYKTDSGFAWRFDVERLFKAYPQIMAGLSGENCFNGNTLFIKGQNSDYIAESHRETIQRYFPNSQAKVIHNTGHWLHAEKPTTFNRIVNDFLTD